VFKILHVTLFRDEVSVVGNRLWPSGGEPKQYALTPATGGLVIGMLWQCICEGGAIPLV
jgi:hypothetical protein